MSFHDLRDNEQCWVTTLTSLHAQGDARKSYKNLIWYYIAAPGRYYHTPEHILHCFAELAETAILPKNLDAVKMALWFHDAIYNPRANDNEEQSAKLFHQFAQNAVLPPDFISTVTRLILATHHRVGEEEPDAQLVLDIDLSILGQSPDRFDEYEEQIRKEYSFVTSDIFWLKRTEILTSFLRRSLIYYTNDFQDKYEAQARRNIVRSLHTRRESILKEDTNEIHHRYFHLRPHSPCGVPHPLS